MAMANPEPNTGCWFWSGAIAAGYGVFTIAGAQLPAHRAALSLLRNVALPRGHSMHVDHLCSNKLCVNPEHLELVSAAENIRRRDTAKENQPCA